MRGRYIDYDLDGVSREEKAELLKSAEDGDSTRPADFRSTFNPDAVPHFRDNAAHMFFDVYKELTTNVDFINRCMKVYRDMILADRAGDREAFRHHMAEMLRMCDYNVSMLIPFFFPNFADGKAMTLYERPHAMAMMSMVPAGTLTVCAARQVGKCLAGDTAVDAVVDGEARKATMREIFNKAKAAAA